MANSPPTAKKLLHRLDRNKPGFFVESMGLLVVLGCAIAGVFIAVEIGGQAIVIWFGAGAVLGLTVGVVAYQFLLNVLGYKRSPSLCSMDTEHSALEEEHWNQPKSAQNDSNDDDNELIPSNRNQPDLKYTEADFPCPPALPGRKTELGSNFCDFYHKPGEVAFAVVQPDHEASSQELKTIGERLQLWKAGNEHIKRILGLEQLLQGTLPILRADMFSLAARSDRVYVALIYVTESADNETTGEELLRRMAGLAVYVVSPAYFSKIRE